MPPDMAVVPPTMPLFSRITTSPAPKSCAAIAAVMAAPPDPRTTTSASRSQVISSDIFSLPRRSQTWLKPPSMRNSEQVTKLAASEQR